MYKLLREPYYRGKSVICIVVIDDWRELLCCKVIECMAVYGKQRMVAMIFLRNRT